MRSANFNDLENSVRFGEYLAYKNLISEDALREALRAQRFTKERIGRLLRDLGHLDQMGLNRSLWFFLKPECPYPLEELKEKVSSHSTYDLTSLLDKRPNKILLAQKDEKAIELVGTFYRDEVVESVEEKTGLRVSFFTIKPEAFSYLEKSALPDSKNKKELALVKKQDDDERLSVQGPYNTLFQEALRESAKSGASDVHMIPIECGVEIRFRVNGELKLWKSLTVEHQEPFIQAAKMALGLDLAISGRPQDGRASYRSLKTDVRVNALPTLYGDKVVLRLIPQEQKFDLNGMGLTSEALQTLKSAVSKKQGLVLISGPTGSGKTTTLYSLLSSLDRNRLNITTLENPVEMRLSGITQVDVGRARGISFADSLRALMRQDPDVILIGEIRDRETAEMALQAGATGHLVLSTIHANGAREVVDRLVNLRVERQSIQENLKLSAAQRLVRLLCPHCRIPLSPDELNRLGELYCEDTELWKKGPGCEACQHSGVIGRRPLLEYLFGADVERALKGAVGATNSMFNQVLGLAKKGEVCVYDALSFA